MEDPGSVDAWNTNETTVTQTECNLCAVATQHPCRICGIPVCNLTCSVQDPRSENEAHRTHKTGDRRCVVKYMNASIPFSCPKSAKEFKEITNFNKHMEEDHDVFQLSFPNLSLESGSISKLRMIRWQCGKLFANELDLKNHLERVHEYGELFQL